MSEQKSYLRFSVAQRLEHGLLLLSFTILGITGLPQKFVGMPWAESMIAAMGGIETVRIIHRYAAIVLMALSIYHVIAVAYKIFVQRVELTMMPDWQDLKDLLGVLAYNLGLSRLRPKLPRYNFEEKMEYWAVVWGTVIMAITGFMLWNPIASAKFLPGSFIPAAKAAHGGEALLAVLAIIVWHMYGVHLRRFNKSMFAGQLSYEEMAHEHALELERFERGTLRRPAPPEEEIKRARIFMPIAAIIAMTLIFGLYLFATFEDTAASATLVAEGPRENAFQPLTTASRNGGNMHVTIEEYTGPESCAASGCHTARPLETAATSAHNQRIAAAGPHPWLAKLVESETAAGGAIPGCLVCHAQDYQADDLLASARTVRAAGGKTCLRCHSSDHAENSVHAEVGLACVSCHTTIDHQIQTEVACQSCHAEMPHADPFLNTKHTRLDCRTCHVRNDTQLIVDASQPTLNSVTGFFEPTIERSTSNPQYIWQTEDGSPASVDTTKAVIVPVIPTTLLAPAEFDPAAFALTGKADGAIQETTINITASHGVTRQGVRTCDTCHGPNGDFDFAGLGYTEEQADSLSAKPAETEE